MLSHLPVSLRRIVIATSISIILSALIPVPTAMAQTTGTLIGQVFNEQGQPISGAKITIINEDSGNEYATVTDGSGSYRRPLLPPGNYRITASQTNYSPGSANVRVPLNATTEIKPPLITLKALAPTNPIQTPTGPTPTGPTVPVTGPTPTGQVAGVAESSSLINKTDATRSGNFTERELESLPLGGGATMRSFDELALLVPGVLPPPYTPGVRGPGVGFGIGTAGQFAVNGLRARSNNFTIDGSDNNDPDVGVRRQGFVALVPQSIESVQEFQISTLLWDAELGRNFGSQVNAVSKGGPAAIHGQAYGFFTHNSLNARNAFDFLGGFSEGEDPFTRLQAGAVIGGPIGKTKKTQWFASYEYLNINSSVEQHFATPTVAERGFRDAREIFTPIILGTELAILRSRRAAPVGQNIFSLYPLPNNPGGPFGDNTFTTILPADGDGSVASFRLTHQLTPNNTFNARYNFTDDNRVLPSVNRAIRSSIIADSRTQNLSLILDSALTLNLFNQARFSFGRTRLDFPAYPGNRFSPCTSSSFNPIPDDPLVFCSDNFDVRGGLFIGDTEVPLNVSSDTGPLGQVIIEPFSPVGVDVFTFPNGRVNNTFQYADTLSLTYRMHSFKFGADIRRFQLNSRQDRNFRPVAVFGIGTFANAFIEGDNIVFDDTLFAESNATNLAAIGLPASIFQTLSSSTPNSTIGLRTTEYNFFFNDNVRIHPKVTLDFGVRYEYNSVPREVNNRIEDALSLQSLPPDTNPDPSVPEFQFFLDTFNQALSSYQQILDGRTKIYDPDRNNLAPHFGFAWAPNLRTAIRAGYGIYYDSILGAVVSQSRNVFPNEIGITTSPGFFGGNAFDLLNPAFLAFLPDPNNLDPSTFLFLIKRGTLNQFGIPPEFARIGLGAVFASELGALTFTLPEKNLRTPYAQHWHLTVEHEVLPNYLISAAYVGTKATKLTRLTTPNLGPNSIPNAVLIDALGDRPLLLSGSQLALNIGSSFPIDRPIPSLGSFQIFENSASSIYHALQFEARKRFSRGYSFTAAYTWSHAIDDVSDVFPIAGAPVLPQDSRNLRLERADANFDVRHRFVGSLVWDLPFYRGAIGRTADILGGWQVTTIFQAHTGQPFTLNLPFDANLDGNLTDRPATTDGLVFFDGHGSQRVSLSPDRNFLNFLNTTGFFGFDAERGLFRPFLFPGTGFVGRNTVRGDGFINLDMALAKNFRFNESQALEFRTEVFNVLNRTNYGLPIRTIGAPGFGSSIDTVNPARIIQFAFKYSF